MMIDLLPWFSNQEVVDTLLEVGVEHVGEDHEDFAEHYEEFVGLVEVEVASELGDVLEDMEQLIQQSNRVGQSIHDILALEGYFFYLFEEVWSFTAFLEPDDERIQDLLFDPGIQILLLLQILQN